MSSLFAEPVSPLLDYEEDQEPELEGLRNLSVSTDGTLDSLDENPTPPHSPNPVVHISPPGAKFSSDSSESRFLSFENNIFDKLRDDSPHKKQELEPIDPLCSTIPLSLSRPRSPFLPSLPSYSDIPATPPAIKIAFPLLPSSPAPVPATETLAERRASLGKLSNRALLSLQQMRFESSEDAGMGLGVGPPSAGLEGIEGTSPGSTTGKIFQLAMGIDSDFGHGQSATLSVPRSPLLAAPGIENEGRPLQRSRSTGSLRSPRSRSSARSNRPYSIHAPASPSFSPSSSRPASPVVKRSSAFTCANNGPLTPLTPSHVPGAPSLGAGGSAFEWFSYSTPESPVSPGFPGQQQQQQKLPRFEQLAPVQLPLTPTSDCGSITPTAGKTSFTHQHQRTTSGRIAASPLGRGRFDEASSSAGSNPFFASD